MAVTPTTWLDQTLANPDSTGFQGQQQIIGLSNGNILVVFADDSTTSPSPGRDITAVIYDAEGNIVRSAWQLNGAFFQDTEHFPSIAATNDGGFVMAYQDDDASGASLRIEKYNSSGNQSAFGTILQDPGAPVLANPKLAVNLADNSIFVSYEHHDGNNDTIRGRKISADLSTVGAEQTLRTDEDPTNTLVTGDPRRQDTAALTDGRFVTVFDEGDEFNGLNDNGIEVRISNADGTNGSNISVTEINNTADGSARVAGLADGGFVVAWVESEETNGSFDNNIKYRVYNADGSSRTEVLTAADSLNNHSGVDVIALEDGTFFLAWEDNTFNELEGQLYSADGALVGSELDIVFTGTPVNPELGTTSDGRILVTYQTLSGGNDVQFKILDPRDSIITAEIGDGQTTGRVTGSTIIGSDENDILLGQGGNDLFQYVQDTTSSANVDTIDGGGGVNTFEITTLTAQRIVDLQAGVFATGDITATASTRATLANIQNVIVAGAQDVRGDGNANVLTAVGNFTNVFEGGGGADTLDGGGGNDTLRGGAGGDTYDNVEAGDLLVELLNEGYDIVNTAQASYTLGANFERVNYTGAGNFVGTGNNLSNRFSGNVGDDRFVDTFGGADIFSGGQGFDTVDFRTAGTGATINFVTSTMGGSAAGDTFSSIEGYWGSNTAGDQMTALAGNLKFYGFGGNDTLNGGSGADLLSGGNGNDSLSGGGNVDNIQGGLGNDTQNGGAGADLFVFVEAAFGQDLINDFTDGSDRLKVFSAVANDISDFTILGNGGTFVTLFLNANASQTITLLGAAPITLTAGDFVFY